MWLIATQVTAAGEHIECRQDPRPDREASALVKTVGVRPESAQGRNTHAA